MLNSDREMLFLFTANLSYVRGIYSMCLAIPLKLIEIDGNNAVGEAMGMQRRLRVDFIENPRLGEYVIVHAGFAIERLSEAQALEDLEAWSEVEDALSQP